MWNNPWHVRRAAAIIEAGGIIAYPTESVWGLGCDPWNELAVSRLLWLKHRPIEKGLILACGDIGQIPFLWDQLNLPEQQTVRKPQTRPTTWLLPDPLGSTPEWIRGEHDSVAVRVSEHKLIQDICACLGYPIVSTSANPSAKAPARSALRVRQYFSDHLDYIVPGSLGQYALPSQIIDLKTGQPVRM